MKTGKKDIKMLKIRWLAKWLVMRSSRRVTLHPRVLSWGENMLVKFKIRKRAGRWEEQNWHKEYLQLWKVKREPKTVLLRLHIAVTLSYSFSCRGYLQP